MSCRAKDWARIPDGEPRWWVLPTKLNDMTKEAIAVAVARVGCPIVAIARTGGHNRSLARS
jgi:hypothetical protein